MNLIQEASNVFRRCGNISDTHTVHPWCSVVSEDQVLRSRKNVALVYPIIQCVKPESRLLLRLDVKLLPQPEDPCWQTLTIHRKGVW